MNKITHTEMVRVLKKDGQQLIDELTPSKADLQHMGIGVCGEAGELLDGIKKHTIYNKEIDRNNIIEELGDLEFYMEGIRQNLNITREETLEANIKKLEVRYNRFKYSNQAAQNRADKIV